MRTTVEWYELLWVGMGLIAFGASIEGLLTVWGDYIYAQLHPHRNSLVQLQIMLVSRVYVYYESLLVCAGFVITIIGLRSLLLPPNPGSSSWGALGIGLLLFAFAGAVAWVSVQTRIARRRFERLLVRKEEPMKTVKHWTQSRTIWVSIAGMVVAFALAALTVLTEHGDSVTMPLILAALLAGFNALNARLRFLTDTPVTVKRTRKPKPPAHTVPLDAMINQELDARARAKDEQS